ncbi:MAG: hypothetical protein IGQ45_00460 [Cyanobacterium sp. T60_A2020_053]|nr:hypothetical protein [Cyanobacterium sp. T60_A2020_053]
MVVVPELVNSSLYGIIDGRRADCSYANKTKLRDAGVLMIVKYNQDTATPIKSFRANLQR